jgi:protein-tyrosine-phosphatase
MAEGLFTALVARKDRNENWLIASAGTWADNGSPATNFAQQTMDEMGIDIKTHRSRLITAEIMESYKLILVMERNHKEALRIEFPQVKQKVFLLSEMAGLTTDIEDPVGGSLEDYRETSRQILKIIEEGFQKIEKESLEENP